MRESKSAEIPSSENQFLEQLASQTLTKLAAVEPLGKEAISECFQNTFDLIDKKAPDEHNKLWEILSVQLHPDKNPGHNLAYEVLVTFKTKESMKEHFIGKATGYWERFKARWKYDRDRLFPFNRYPQPFRALAYLIMAIPVIPIVLVELALLVALFIVGAAIAPYYLFMNFSLTGCYMVFSLGRLGIGDTFLNCFDPLVVRTVVKAMIESLREGAYQNWFLAGIHFIIIKPIQLAIFPVLVVVALVQDIVDLTLAGTALVILSLPLIILKAVHVLLSLPLYALDGLTSWFCSKKGKEPIVPNDAPCNGAIPHSSAEEAMRRYSEPGQQQAASNDDTAEPQNFPHPAQAFAAIAAITTPGDAAELERANVSSNQLI